LDCTPFLGYELGEKRVSILTRLPCNRWERGILGPQNAGSAQKLVGAEHWVTGLDGSLSSHCVGICSGQDDRGHGAGVRDGGILQAPHVRAVQAVGGE